MNGPEIPEGWRLLTEGEPIPTDTMWLNDNNKNVWIKLNPESLDAGERYSESFRPMITRHHLHWVNACGVIDIGTDR